MKLLDFLNPYMQRDEAKRQDRVTKKQLTHFNEALWKHPNKIQLIIDKMKPSERF